MRFHGTEPREPWEYDAFTVKVYRYYTWLRENLRPYIVSVAAEAHKLGIPMMRPLAMMYPEDQEATKVWDEYLSEKIFWLRRFLMKQKSGKSIFLRDGGLVCGI